MKEGGKYPRIRRRDLIAASAVPAAPESFSVNAIVRSEAALTAIDIRNKAGHVMHDGDAMRAKKLNGIARRIEVDVKKAASTNTVDDVKVKLGIPGEDPQTHEHLMETLQDEKVENPAVEYEQEGKRYRFTRTSIGQLFVIEILPDGSFEEALLIGSRHVPDEVKRELGIDVSEATPQKVVAENPIASDEAKRKKTREYIRAIRDKAEILRGDGKNELVGGGLHEAAKLLEIFILDAKPNKLGDIGFILVPLEEPEVSMNILKILKDDASGEDAVTNYRPKGAEVTYKYTQTGIPGFWMQEIVPTNDFPTSNLYLVGANHVPEAVKDKKPQSANEASGVLVSTWKKS